MGAEPRLLTPEEAADRIRVSTKTLRGFRQRGLIRYVSISERKILYRPEDCDAFVAERVKVEDPTPRPAPRRGRRTPPRNTGNVIGFMARRQQREAGGAAK